MTIIYNIYIYIYIYIYIIYIYIYIYRHRALFIDTHTECSNLTDVSMGLLQITHALAHMKYGYTLLVPTNQRVPKK